MRNMRKGYFTPPVLIILAIIIFAVATLIAINTDLVKRINKEPSPTSSSSPTTQQSSPTPSAIANWEPYANEEIGVGFQHPPEAELSIIENCLTTNCIGKGIRLFYFEGDIDREEAFGTHLTEGLIIDISQIDTKGENLKDALNNLYSGVRMSEGTLKELKAITLGGFQGYQATSDYTFTWLSAKGKNSSKGTSITIYINTKNGDFTISSTYTEKYVAGYEKIYNQILSTFKFLN